MQAFGDTHTALYKRTLPFTHILAPATHLLHTPSPKPPVLSPLDLYIHLPPSSKRKLSQDLTCRLAIRLPTLAPESSVTFVCLCSRPNGGERGSCSAVRATLGAEDPMQVWSEWGVGGGGEPERRAPPNPARARGPRLHLSSHYCNKSELHYMKGKMNYRR